MKLRKLKLSDAPLMLEWMHDPDVVKDLRANFASKTIEDCQSFIIESQKDKDNVHYAIVSNKDEYMGTVSLKDIDRKTKSAEFGIVVRKAAMGAGYSWYGMSHIFKIAFEKLGLDFVYWCVSEKNERACRFYDKHHFPLLKDVPDFALKRYQGIPDMRWYVYSKNNHDDIENKEEVLGCKIIRIKTISTLGSGQLSFFESNRECPFDIKRIYYITKVPEGIRRGFHAHKDLKQLVFCPYGEICFVLDDGKHKEEILLNDPSIAILIEKPIWREMVWIKEESVLCVCASEYYDEGDYIRNYEEFKRFINK